MQGLIDQVPETGNDDLTGHIQNRINDWPVWQEGENPRGFELASLTDPLNEDRNSFELDTDGLPPAPPSVP